MSSEITLTLNGEPLTVPELPGQSLLDLLRNGNGLMATRLGCGQGQCGACRVLLDDVAVPACDTPVWAVAGKRVTTLEGLGDRARPHPLQTAFIAQQALQCGFCTSGMIMTAAALLRRNAHPTADEVRAALDDNLCRCGVHNRVVQAVIDVAAA